MEALDDGREAAEVRRNELDVRARFAQEPLGRPEEAGEQVDPGLGEQREEIDEQRAEHLEALEVVAFTERVKESGRLTGPERDREPVVGPDGRDRGVHRAERHRYRTASRISPTCVIGPR